MIDPFFPFCYPPISLVSGAPFFLAPFPFFVGVCSYRPRPLYAISFSYLAR